MGRLAGRVVGVVSVLVTASLAATVAPAMASQSVPRTSWVQPGTGPLDGLGTFLFVNAPAPGPTQGSPVDYEYTMFFTFENASHGVLALGRKDGQKVVGFMLMESHPVIATVPFDWQFGRIYYLLTYRIAVDVWAAWVYDWSTTTWTHVATQTEAGIGRMLPTTSTSVDWNGPPPPDGTCAFYPRVDAFWYPPTGWRGAVMTQATLGADSVSPGGCPSTTTTSDGWQHHTLGAAG